MNTPTSDRPTRKRGDITRRRWLDGASLLSLLAALMLIFATGLFGARGLNRPRPVVAELAAVLTPSPTLTPSVTPTPTRTATPAPTATATLVPTPVPPTIAIIAGHRNNDSGAVCETGEYEGLQEVHVTTEVTTLLVERMRAAGYAVVDLDEFDARLSGLKADALVSIHADSCVEWEGTTGFKVARALNSAIPEVEDAFVACVEREYGATTGLSVHPGSITHNMLSYHAFRTIDPDTPAVIVEVGFLFHDHDLLVDDPARVAEGLASGVECFLTR